MGGEPKPVEPNHCCSVPRGTMRGAGQLSVSGKESGQDESKPRSWSECHFPLRLLQGLSLAAAPMRAHSSNNLRDRLLTAFGLLLRLQLPAAAVV